MAQGQAPARHHIVYDVETGDSITLEGASWDWGWTAEGDLFRVRKDEVTTCSASTGDCRTERMDLPDYAGQDGPVTSEAVLACGPKTDECVLPEEGDDAPELPALVLGGHNYSS